MNQSVTSSMPPLVDRFVAMWQLQSRVPDVFEFLASHSKISPEEATDICRIDLQNRWQGSDEIPVEQYLAKLPMIGTCKRLKLSLVQEEFFLRQKHGQVPSVENFVLRFPDLSELLQTVLPAN